MRALIVAALLVLPASPVLAEMPCWTPDAVIARIGQVEGITHTFVKDEQADALQRGLMTISGALSMQPDRTFLIFSRAEGPTVLIIGFFDGCLEDSVEIGRALLRQWLGEVG